MRYVFRTCLLSLLLLILAWPLVAHAENLPQPHVWDQTYPFSNPLKIDNFTIIYNQEKIGKIPELVDSIQYSYDDIDRYFGDYMSSSSLLNGYTTNSYIFRTTVEVAADDSEFRLLTGVGNVPGHTKALNWNEGINGLVVIKSPDTLPDFRQVLTYQLACIAERTMMTKYRSMPEWYLDGTATYVADNVTEGQRYAARIAADQGSWMSLDELDAAYKNMTIYNMGEPYYSNARAQSAVLITYIGQSYGNSNLIGILKDYSSNGNLTRAFINRTGGHDPESINVNLMNSLAGNMEPAVTEEKSIIDGYLNFGNGKPAGRLVISFSRSGTVTNLTTSPVGSYTANLAPGTYKITVQGQTISDSNTITVKAGETVHRNVTLAVTPTPSASPPSKIETGDLVIPGLAVAVNLVALVALLAILRRNWH